MEDETEQQGGNLYEGGKKKSNWMQHVSATMKANKGKSLKQVLKMAAKTYRKTGKVTAARKTAKKTSKKGMFGLYGGKKRGKTRKNSQK